MLVAVVAGHILVLALLLALHFVPAVPIAEHGLTVLSLAAARRAPPAAPPPSSPPVPSRPKPIVAMADVVATADLPFDPGTIAIAGALAGDSCDLAAAVQERLSTAPTAIAAIDDIPPAARSVANAVMIWDGRWSRISPADGAPQPAGTLPETRIRWAVIEVLLSAAPACRDAIIRGPRFLLVSRPTGNAVLVFGSGQWRWADLLQSLAPADSTTEKSEK